jgi:hypothetical protein
MSRRAVFGELQQTRKHRPEDWRWSAFHIVMSTNKHIQGTPAEKKKQAREFVQAMHLAIRGPDENPSMLPPDGQLPEMRFLALIKNPKEDYVDTDEVLFEDDAIIRPPVAHRRRERAPKRHPDQRRQFFLDTEHELFWPENIRVSDISYKPEENHTRSEHVRGWSGGRFHVHVEWVVGHKYFLHLRAHRLQNEINRVLDETESPFRVHYTAVTTTKVPLDYYLGWTAQRGPETSRAGTRAATLDDMGWPDYGPEYQENAEQIAEEMIRQDTRGDQSEMPADVVPGVSTQTAVRSIFDDLGIVHATHKAEEPYLYLDPNEQPKLLLRRGEHPDYTAEEVRAMTRHPPWVRPDEALAQYNAWKEENPEASVNDFVLRYPQARQWVMARVQRAEPVVQPVPPPYVGNPIIVAERERRRLARMVNDPLAGLFAGNVAGERDVEDITRPPTPDEERAPQP